jgi:predicted DNA-binding transcriptional regulator AlpA
MPPPKITKPSVLAPGDRFLNAEETAELLATSTATLNFWRVCGRGPRFFRHGRSIRYLLSDVTSWATARPSEPEKLRA